MIAKLARRPEDAGFTLIELLVVMIIIGILAAIAIPAFLSQKNKGYEASQKSDLRSIATEIGTRLVDEPSSMTLTDAGGGITFASTGSTNSTIALSPGNTLVTAIIQVPTPAAGKAYGDFCVQLHNTKGGSDWSMVRTGNSAQLLNFGACT